MIEPHDLMSLADRLAAVQAEPEGRAAVSRAYYSAFHVARMLIENGCAVVLPSGGEIHKKLQFCLEESQNAELVQIADRLHSLREERNRTDYKLADSRFGKPANVIVQIKIAREIVQQVKAAEAQLATFRPVVRKYASEVLKLGVR